MRFLSTHTTYQKGQVLDAGSLNDNLALGRFLGHEGYCGRLSDGVVNGLLVRKRGESLFITPGVFKLAGKVGWLRQALSLELPPAGVPAKLWLNQTDKEDEWSLEWHEKNEGHHGICLCALQLSDRKLLTDAWIFEDAPVDVHLWHRKLNTTGDIHLEFTMAASLGQKPTLLPLLQHRLAAMTQNDNLRMWLLNGLWLMESLGVPSWEQGLERLHAEIAQLKEPARTGYNSEINLAID